MRSGLRVLCAVAIAAGVAACEPRDERVDVFETEELAPGVDAPLAEAVITADLEPTDHATTDVSGTVRIYAARTAATGATGYGPGTTPGTGDDVQAAQGFTVEVMARGLQPNTEYGWRINRGDCGDERAQAVVTLAGADAGEAITQPLRSDQVGSAQATATVPAQQLTLAQLEDEDYTLTLHRSAGDAQQAIACADLNGGIF